MYGPKILVMAGSLRAGSHNGRLAALVAKELALTEAQVTRISLADYPLPLLDADVFAVPPDNAVKLKRMGVSIICSSRRPADRRQPPDF